MSCLLVTQGPLFGSSVPIAQELTIGRAVGATLQIFDLQVSRLHATLRRQGQDVYLVDATSRNGVFVNEQRVEGTLLLKPLDEIRIGSTRMVLDAPEQVLKAQDSATWAILGGAEPPPFETLPVSPDPTLLLPDLERLRAWLEPGLSPDVLRQRALEWLLERLGAERVALWFQRPDGSLALLHVLPGERPLLVNHALLLQCLEYERQEPRAELPPERTGPGLLYDGPLSLTWFFAGHRRMGTMRRALLVLPFRCPGLPPGLLWIEREERGERFSHEQVHWLASVVPWLARALEVTHTRALNQRRDEHEQVRQEGIRLSGEKLLQATGLMERARTLARGDGRLAIIGPHGIGKDRIARAIHRMSLRAEAPFVTLNCAALSEAQLRLELFGAEPEALPGLERGYLGQLERCVGGTVVLLETEALSQGVQAELLRVLLQGQIMRRGSERPVLVDVRLLASSSRPPEQWHIDGKLRVDLIPLLAPETLVLPRLESLAERFGELTRDLIGRMNLRLASQVRDLSPTALEWLKRREYPLQLWDLEDLIARAMPLCEGSMLTRSELEMAELAPGDANADAAVGARYSDTLRDKEKRVYRQAMQLTGQNRAEAASMLGIPRRTFERKLLDFGLVER